MTIQVDSIEPTTTANYINLSNSRVQSVLQSGSLAASGTLILNWEAIWGLGTTGYMCIRGNENGGNASQRFYIITVSSYASGNRQVNLRIMGEVNMGNNYGNVYAYLGPYSGSVTTANQSHTGTSNTVSDIRFRNSQGAGCSYALSLWRTG